MLAVLIGFFVHSPLLTLQLAGAAGMFAHWMKRYFLDQTEVGPLQFLWNNRKAIAGAHLIEFAAIMSMFAAGTPIEITRATLALAWLGGFGLNSIFTPHDASSDPSQGKPIL